MTQATCTKKKYSRMGALMAIAAAQNENNAYRPVRAYKCHGCRNYHLTSKPAMFKNGVKKFGVVMS
jgi:hypothetical protein